MRPKEPLSERDVALSIIGIIIGLIGAGVHIVGLIIHLSKLFGGG